MLCSCYRPITIEEVYGSNLLTNRKIFKIESPLWQRVLFVSVKFHLRHQPTNKETDKQARLFVCFLLLCLLVRCVCQRRPSYGWTKRDASQKFKRVGINNR